MTGLIYRLIKGTPLTLQEGDTNLQKVEDAVDALGGSPTATSVSTNQTPDFAVATQFEYEVSGDITINNPTNRTLGMNGVIILKQDSTGGRTITLGDAFKFEGGTAPTFSTTADAIDIIPFYVINDLSMACGIMNDVK